MAVNKQQLPESNRASPEQSSKKSSAASILLTFCILLVFWLLFSGKYDRFHIILGIISCSGVTAFCHRFFFPKGVTVHIFTRWLKFGAYIPWLFKEIFWANLHMLYLTFHPNMKELINPKIITFKTELKSDEARGTFANSITLTPGTITVYAGVMGTFAVHCIDDQSGKALPGKMEEKIGEVFDENG